jgi:hypothetical protein
MVKVVISYRLRQGVTQDRYRQWSRETDQPLASKQPGVLQYEVYEVNGSGTSQPPYCDVVEIISADSWDAWQKVNERPEMKDAVESWKQICEPDSVMVVYGTKIEP